MADLGDLLDLSNEAMARRRRLASEYDAGVRRQQAASAYNLGNDILTPTDEGGGYTPVAASGRGTGLPGPIGAMLSAIPGMAQVATPSPLTEAEKRELEHLRSLKPAAEAAAPPAEDVQPEPTAPEGPGVGESFLRGAGEGATMGFGSEGGGTIAAGLQALVNRLPQSVRDRLDLVEAPAGEAYTFTRDANDQANDAAQRAHGGAYLGGNFAGGLLTAPLMPGVGGAKAIGPAMENGAFQTLGSLMRTGAKVGLGTGLASGLGSSRADLTTMDPAQYLRAAKDTGLGGMVGLGLGVGLPVAAGAAGWTARNVGAPVLNAIRGGFVKPTPEAQRLGQQGVNLTLGQMDPASSFGRLEELASKKALLGSLDSARQGAAGQARDALMRGAGAPGATPPTAGAPVAQQLEELAAGFSGLYDEALGGAKVQPGFKLDVAFDAAAKARDVDASPAVRRQAAKWLSDQAQTLKTDASGSVDARSVQALRTQIRDNIRNLADDGPGRQLAQIYGRAEKSVTDLLEGGLPAENASKLRAADGAYRNLLATRDAAQRAFTDPEQKFTPAQLLQAIKSRGSTPGLERTARDAQSVFGATYPPTGIQVAATEGVPGLRTLGPAWASLANASPFLKSHALNQLWTPGLPARALSATGRALEGAAESPRVTSQASRRLIDMLHPPQQPMQSFADSADEELPPWAVAP